MFWKKAEFASVLRPTLWHSCDIPSATFYWSKQVTRTDQTQRGSRFCWGEQHRRICGLIYLHRGQLQYWVDKGKSPFVLLSWVLEGPVYLLPDLTYQPAPFRRRSAKASSFYCELPASLPSLLFLLISSPPALLRSSAGAKLCDLGHATFLSGHPNSGYPFFSPSHALYSPLAFPLKEEAGWKWVEWRISTLRLLGVPSRKRITHPLGWKLIMEWGGLVG